MMSTKPSTFRIVLLGFLYGSKRNAMKGENKHTGRNQSSNLEQPILRSVPDVLAVACRDSKVGLYPVN